MSFSDRIVYTEIERRAHANWTRRSSRIWVVIGRTERAVEPRFMQWSLGACEGNRRLRRPVKATRRAGGFARR